MVSVSAVLRPVGMGLFGAVDSGGERANPRASAAASAAAARSSRLAFAFGFLPAPIFVASCCQLLPPTGVETAAPCAFLFFFFFFVTASAPATTAPPGGAPEVFFLDIAPRRREWRRR